MYKSFLSWRYLLRRPVNLIGIVGILVGTGALILILSIMSGFLAETRTTVRGSLADLVIEPSDHARGPGRDPGLDPAPLLAIVRADPRVRAACAQLTWFGILAPTGEEARFSQIKLFDPQNAGRAGVQLVGIDVADELEVTELEAALKRDSRLGDSRVADVKQPFAPPPEYTPDGKPLPSVLVGEQLAAASTRGSSRIAVTTGAGSTGAVPLLT